MVIAPPESRTPAASGGIKSSRRVRRLSKRDKVVLALMVVIPTLVHVALVWLPGRVRPTTDPTVAADPEPALAA